MNPKVKWTLYGVVLVWAALNWVAGSRVQTAYLAEAAKLKGQSLGIIKVHKVDFDRGFFTSKAVAHLEVRPDPCKPGVNMEVHEKIRNDLVSGLGALRSTVTLKFGNAEWNRALEKVLNGKPLLEISGVHPLGGGMRYTGVSPASTVTEKGASLTWKGLTFELAGKGDDSSATLDFPGLVLESDQLDMVVRDLKFHANSRKTVIGLETGDSAFSLAEARFELAAGASAVIPGFTLKEIQAGNRVELKSGRAFSTSDLRIGSADVGRESFGIETSLAMNQMDTEALKRLVAAARESSQTCKPDLKPILTALVGLFDGTAEVALKKLNVTMGDKRLSVDGNLVGLDLPATLPDRGMAALDGAGLLEGGKMRLRIRANEAMLFGAKLPGEQAGQVLSQLRSASESGGVIRREGEDYVTELTLEGNEVALNGVPWREALQAGAATMPAAGSTDEEDVLAEWRRPGSSF